MYIEWYKMIALLFAIPGGIVLLKSLRWSLAISWSVFTAEKGTVDGLSAFAGILGLLAIIGIAIIFSIAIFIFGANGILYAISSFGLFSIFAYRILLE